MTYCLRAEEINCSALNGENLYLNLPKFVNEIRVDYAKLRNLHIPNPKKLTTILTAFLHKIIAITLMTRRLVSYN